MALHQLSEVFLSVQKNNLDISKKTKDHNYQTTVSHNIRYSTDGNDINSDDESPISIDSESCDSDDQPEPDMDYQKELLSRMMYYGEYENSEISTPISKKPEVPAGESTPLASSTMIKDCSKSMVRNNTRRKNRSTPLASSTMMEDLLADIEANHPEEQTTTDGSILTWSIDDSTETKSLQQYYKRHFDVSSYDWSTSDGELSTGFWTGTDADLSTIFSTSDNLFSTYDSEMTSSEIYNSNCKFPRTSTSCDLLRNTGSKATSDVDEQKKIPNGKQPISRLLFLIRTIKKNLTKKRPSKSRR